MKILTVDHITVADLVEDDIFLDPSYGHVPAEGVTQLLNEFHAIKVYLRSDGGPTWPFPAGADDRVTRLNVQRRAWVHGLRSTYGGGCRCVTCTEAQRAYMRDYQRERRADEKEGRPVTVVEPEVPS
jgi:hypothetical protein